MQARTRQACLLATVALALVVVLAGSAPAQSSQTNIGTWNINLAKSKFTDGKAPKSSTFTVVAAGAGIKVTSDSVRADGSVAHSVYAANYDGKDNPITGNSQWGDGTSASRVEANTTRPIFKKGGKVTVTQNAVVSSDGKTMTITTTGTNTLGQTINSVAVYDKQ